VDVLTFFWRDAMINIHAQAVAQNNLFTII